MSAVVLCREVVELATSSMASCSWMSTSFCACFALFDLLVCMSFRQSVGIADSDLKDDGIRVMRQVSFRSFFPFIA